MEAEHMIAKELILGHDQYEKLDNSNGIQIPEVKPLFQISLRLYSLYKNIQILKNWICFTKKRSN